ALSQTVGKRYDGLHTVITKPELCRSTAWCLRRYLCLSVRDWLLLFIERWIASCNKSPPMQIQSARTLNRVTAYMLLPTPPAWIVPVWSANEHTSQPPYY